MNSKPDIKRESSLPWNRYKDKQPEEALKQLYADTHNLSSANCNWYWTSIRTKRWTSLSVRFLSFLLLLGGTALPLLASLSDDTPARLACTQVAVTLLAGAGLLQVADKIFGWSTGWMRYVTTVTEMEVATTAFDIEWSKYLIAKSGAIDAADVKALFAFSEELERQLMKLQTDETNKWVADFNAGLSLLDSLIKAQREETKKQFEALGVTVSDAQAAAKASEQAKIEAESERPGALNVSFIYKSEPKPLCVLLDDRAPEEFLGSRWTKANIPPGLHTIEVRPMADAKASEQQCVLIEPGAIASIEFKLLI